MEDTINTTMKGSLLAFTDDSVLSINAVSNAVSELGIQGVEQCDHKIITQASSLNQLPVGSFSFETIICICRSVEFPTDRLFKVILRVLKPGGTILIHKNPQSTMGGTDKVMNFNMIFLQINSALEHKLLLASFLEVRVLKSTVPSEVQSFRVKAKKPSWKIGSSLAIKKATKLYLKSRLMMILM
ncbi:hypothetical protein SO802_023017 [Lithocarpus litseifolius]|uniref:Methyltransferase type 11 domain-containing protein n=1 Tax=Lithocarpus litseifolius TaxID=425828 RepID=A0AAW2C882_9ROSI